LHGLQIVRHCFNIYASSCAALVLRCGDDGHRKLVSHFSVIWRV